MPLIRPHSGPSSPAHRCSAHRRSRSYVLASLRTLHLDLRLVASIRQQSRKGALQDGSSLAIRVMTVRSWPGQAPRRSASAARASSLRSQVSSPLRGPRLGRSWLSPSGGHGRVPGAVRTGMSHGRARSYQDRQAQARRGKRLGWRRAGRSFSGRPLRGVSRLSGQARRQDRGWFRARAGGGRPPRRHVQEALDRSALVPDGSDVKADTKDNVITLTGHVRTWAEHDAVLAAALMARGVIDVRDNLQVTG